MDLPKYFAVFVKNFPSDITKNPVEGIFKRYGSIKSINVVANKDDLNSKCAYINFYELNSALETVRSMNNCMWIQNQLEVVFKTQVKQPPDFRPFTDCKYSKRCSPANHKVRSFNHCVYICVCVCGTLI